MTPVLLVVSIYKKYMLGHRGLQENLGCHVVLWSGAIILLVRRLPMGAAQLLMARLTRTESSLLQDKR